MGSCLVTSGVQQGYVMGPVMLGFFIRDPDTKSGILINTLWSRAVIQTWRNGQIGMLGARTNGSSGPGLEEPDTASYDPFLNLNAEHYDLDKSTASTIQSDFKQQEIPSLFVIYTGLWKSSTRVEPVIPLIELCKGMNSCSLFPGSMHRLPPSITPSEGWPCSPQWTGHPRPGSHVTQ